MSLSAGGQGSGSSGGGTTSAHSRTSSASVSISSGLFSTAETSVGIEELVVRRVAHREDERRRLGALLAEAGEEPGSRRGTSMSMTISA